MSHKVSRRNWLAGSSLAGLGLAAGSQLEAAITPQPLSEVPAGFRVTKGRIRQSVMGWCFKPMPAGDLAGHAREIGLVAIEGIPASEYPTVKKLGLDISLVSSHGFAKGPLSRENHPFCVEKLREGIDLCVEYDCANVITFTGMREQGVTDAAARKNCVECWKSVIGYAEEQGVNLCLEHLNSRDDSHPMKGHPGYFGDDLDLCVDLIRQVDSSRMKLLFDIYHVQVMHGDVIRRLHQCAPYTAHYHTAGNPGRGELDETQEINYPAIMRAILETGYTGYVAQEFIPTWKDHVRALRHAAMVCDV